MAKDYSFHIYGHPNIYNDYSERKLEVYFSEPDHGVNKDTGIVLFIPGFGGNANSNVYKKMRSQFADQHNLITVQCDYFGWEFMQSYPLPESIANFNDMGIMQALDNITAVAAVEQIIIDNGLEYDSGKIIIYGHSHGAYLGYLCNVFAPDLFSLIIDNSAWILPLYLYTDRQLLSSNNPFPITIRYRAKEFVNNKEILNLNNLYNEFNNKCKIVSFHGADDELISFKDKFQVCSTINNCDLRQITKEDINDIFRSAAHGLNADFLLLFNYVMANTSVNYVDRRSSEVLTHTVRSTNLIYEVDYSSKLPVLKITERE